MTNFLTSWRHRPLWRHYFLWSYRLDLFLLIVIFYLAIAAVVSAFYLDHSKVVANRLNALVNNYRENSESFSRLRSASTAITEDDIKKINFEIPDGQARELMSRIIKREFGITLP